MLSFEQFVNNFQLYIPSNFNFECINCKNCCGIEPGVVFVTPNEIEIINKFINEFHCILKVNDNIQFDFIRYIDAMPFLKEMKNFDCVFWSNNIDVGLLLNKRSGCKIYPVRPLQCRNYPFWYTIFSSKDSFNNEMKRCLGFFNGNTYYYSNDIYRKVYDDLVSRHDYFKWILDVEEYKRIYL